MYIAQSLIFALNYAHTYTNMIKLQIHIKINLAFVPQFNNCRCRSKLSYILKIQKPFVCLFS